jgi:hypothetical protein
MDWCLSSLDFCRQVYSPRSQSSSTACAYVAYQQNSVAFANPSRNLIYLARWLQESSTSSMALKTRMLSSVTSGIMRHMQTFARPRSKYPADLVWIGQPNLDRHQTVRLVTTFMCPIHRQNDHTLDRCGALKRSVNVTSKTDPPSGGGSGGNRGGSDHGSDDLGRGVRGRGGHGYRNQDSSEPDAAPPTTKAPTKGAPAGAATQLSSPASCPSASFHQPCPTRQYYR